MRASPGMRGPAAVRGIPRRGSVARGGLEAAGGWCAQGRRHRWWRLGWGGGCMRESARNGGWARRNRPAACRRRMAGGGDAAAGVHDRCARRPGALRRGAQHPPAQGAWFRRRARRGTAAGAALDRNARAAGPAALAAAWSRGVRVDRLQPLRRRQLHPFQGWRYEAERALDPASAARAAAATAGRPPPSSPTLTCIPTPAYQGVRAMANPPHRAVILCGGRSRLWPRRASWPKQHPFDR